MLASGWLADVELAVACSVIAKHAAVVQLDDALERACFGVFMAHKVVFKEQQKGSSGYANALKQAYQWVRFDIDLNC